MSPATAAPERVLYLVSLFPCWSETFIVREIERLLERLPGQLVEITLHRLLELAGQLHGQPHRGLVVPAGTNASSTDANLPISLGVPAVTIDGGDQGRGSHSLDEAYNDGPVGFVGPQWALLVVGALAGVR